MVAGEAGHKFTKLLNYALPRSMELLKICNCWKMSKDKMRWVLLTKSTTLAFRKCDQPLRKGLPAQGVRGVEVEDEEAAGVLRVLRGRGV